MSKSITQDMKYSQSMMKYEKNTVSPRQPEIQQKPVIFAKQLAVHNRRSNNLPLRPLQ